MNPEAGVVIRGTGGLRKLRFPIRGQGKSGGARVIYYFHAEDVPLYLFSVFTKAHKESLTQAERNAFRVALEQLKTALRSK